MKIYLKDSSFAHCVYSNNPMPPKTFSKYLEWDRTPGPSDQTVYTESHLHECKGGIGWIIEPRDLLPHAYDYILNNLDNFSHVWSHDKEFLQQVGPKGQFVPFGGCWIDSFDYGIHPKTEMFSIIASPKNYLPGHILRHQIVAAAGNNIDKFGGGYTYIPNKIDGLRNYRYHFAIENCQKDCWFTEKLIDCFMTGTIPIYWGCSSIGDFFNTDGMVIFDGLHDLKEKLVHCTPTNYELCKEHIEENYKLAQKYLLAEDYIVENNLSK